jgi:hypothetical protein
MQVVVFLCGGREPGATNIAEMANYMSLCTGDDVKNIVVKHFDENDIAKLFVKGAVGKHESKPIPNDEDKTNPIRNALLFMSEHFPRNGRTDIELGFDLQRELVNAKARISLNPHGTNAQDEALVNAVDILCTFEVNPNDLRKYGVSKSTLGIIRYVAKQV